MPRACALRPNTGSDRGDPGHTVHDEDSAARRERHLPVCLFGPRVPEGRGGSRNWARAAGAGPLSGLLTRYSGHHASRCQKQAPPRASRDAYLVARALWSPSTNCIELALTTFAKLLIGAAISGAFTIAWLRQWPPAAGNVPREERCQGSLGAQEDCQWRRPSPAARVAFWCATGRDRARTPPPCRRSTHALRSKPQAPPFLSSAKRVQVRLCHNAGGRAEEVLSRGTARPRARAAYPSPGAPVAPPTHTPPLCVRYSWSDGLLTLTLTLTSSSSSRARLRRDRIPMLVTMP